MEKPRSGDPTLTLAQRPLAGKEPTKRARFRVKVRVNADSGKNQLCFDIRELHGYYVETMNLEFWWAGKRGRLKPHRSPLLLEAHLNLFIEAGKPLHYCLEVVPAELALVGGRIGTSKNWRGRIKWHHRARRRNPDPLPALSRPIPID